MAAKAALKAEDLDYIQQQAGRLFGEVKIALPGYEVTYRTGYESATKGYVITYINGVVSWYWTNVGRPCPEQQFLRRRELSHYAPKLQREMEKAFGKRAATKNFPDIHKKWVHFDCCWPSWSPVLIQIKKLARLYPSLQVLRSGAA